MPLFLLTPYFLSNPGLAIYSTFQKSDPHYWQNTVSSNLLRSYVLKSAGEQKQLLAKITLANPFNSSWGTEHIYVTVSQ